MLSSFRSRLTYANVMATIAVFVALGGSSYAALTVTGKNVRNRSLTAKDIKKNSLTSAEVRDRALLAKDFKTGQLPAGPQGAKGDKGNAGQAGAPGTARAYAIGGSNCGSPGAFCTVLRGKGVAYIVYVATGTYCVGVSGIDASAPDSVALVSVANAQGTPGLYAASWRSTNSACVPNEFEVETRSVGTVFVRNAADNGTTQVSLPASPVGGVRFS